MARTRLAEVDPEFRGMAFSVKQNIALIQLLEEKGIINRGELLAKVAQNEGISVELLKELLEEAIEIEK